MPFSFSTPNPYVTVTNAAVSGTMTAPITGVALPANAGRNAFYIQVVGSGGPLWVAFNSQMPNSGNVAVLLKAATTDFGADGGVLAGDGYAGDVCVSGTVGCRFIAWQNGRGA